MYNSLSFLFKIQKNPPEGIAAGPVAEDNFFEWEAAITGPESTPFQVYSKSQFLMQIAS